MKLITIAIIALLATYAIANARGTSGAHYSHGERLHTTSHHVSTKGY